MITFSKYTDIVNAIAKKLKTTKDAAVNALVKAQQKGLDPLKWQKNLTLLKTFMVIAAENNPTIDERDGTWSNYRNKAVDKKKLGQMNYYWKDLDHMADDDRKKKNMKSRFGIKNIKLDKNGNIIYFESIETKRDYEKEHREEKR
jgi:hypothetical protein